MLSCVKLSQSLEWWSIVFCNNLLCRGNCGPYCPVLSFLCRGNVGPYCPVLSFLCRGNIGPYCPV